MEEKKKTLEEIKLELPEGVFQVLKMLAKQQHITVDILITEMIEDDLGLIKV